MSDKTLRDESEEIFVEINDALERMTTQSRDLRSRFDQAFTKIDAALAASADAEKKATGRLLALEENWDSYGGQAIRREAVDAAIRLRAAVATEPSFVPMSNGGVQVEWHRQGFDIELEISPDGTLQ